MSARRLLVVLAALALARPAQSQETQRCSLEGEPQTQVKLPSGQYNTFVGRGVRVRCPAKSLTLTADSLESFADRKSVV